MKKPKRGHFTKKDVERLRRIYTLISDECQAYAEKKWLDDLADRIQARLPSQEVKP